MRRGKLTWIVPPGDMPEQEIVREYGPQVAGIVAALARGPWPRKPLRPWIYSRRRDEHGNFVVEVTVSV